VEDYHHHQAEDYHHHQVQVYHRHQVEVYHRHQVEDYHHHQVQVYHHHLVEDYHHHQLVQAFFHHHPLKFLASLFLLHPPLKAQVFHLLSAQIFFLLFQPKPPHSTFQLLQPAAPTSLRHHHHRSLTLYHHHLQYPAAFLHPLQRVFHQFHLSHLLLS